MKGPTGPSDTGPGTHGRFRGLVGRLFQGAGEQPCRWCSSLRGFCLLTLRGGTSNRPLQDQSPPSYFIQMLKYNLKKPSLILFRYLSASLCSLFPSSLPLFEHGEKESSGPMREAGPGGPRGRLDPGAAREAGPGAREGGWTRLCCVNEQPLNHGSRKWCVVMSRSSHMFVGVSRGRCPS